jgi:iron-sulfur cluster repair protein YtfE (RIC family)
MKITVSLKNDHEELKRLFGRFKKPGPRASNGRSELFDEIRREILIHSQMESEIFYPALSATASARADELLSAAEQDHQAIEDLLEELTAMSPGEKGFDAKMDALIDRTLRHIDVEEQDIFDEARKNLPEYRLEELGLEMEDRRKIAAIAA